jgi:uncharacterized protein DUF4167
MRNGQNKRMRGRNRKSHNPLTRVYESNGPDVKIRGSAVHIAEKYVQLARDAQSSGDPVSAENYLQHAEHYFRMIASAQEQFRQPSFFRGEGSADMRADMAEDDDEESTGPTDGGEQPAFGTRDPQPYLPRDAQFYSRDQQNFSREQQNFSREPQNFSREPQGYNRNGQGQPAPASGAEDGGSVERLPSFITGAGGQPAAAPATPQTHQGHGSNGYEGQGDRFPLHRRRRRHRGPRNDVAQGGQGGGDGDDTPQGPRGGNDQS